MAGVYRRCVSFRAMGLRLVVAPCTRRGLDPLALLGTWRASGFWILSDSFFRYGFNGGGFACGEQAEFRGRMLASGLFQMLKRGGFTSMADDNGGCDGMI